MQKTILTLLCSFLMLTQCQLYTMRQQSYGAEGYIPDPEFKKELATINAQKIEYEQEEKNLMSRFSNLTTKNDLEKLAQKIEELLDQAKKRKIKLKAASSLILVAVAIILETADKHPQLFAQTEVNVQELNEKYQLFKKFIENARICEITAPQIITKLEEIVDLVNQVVPRKSRWQQFIGYFCCD